MHFLNPPQTQNAIFRLKVTLIIFVLDEINCINIFICEWFHSAYFFYNLNYQGPNLVGIQIW